VLCNEKPPQQEACPLQVESSLCLPELKKACTQQKQPRHNIVKNKQTNKKPYKRYRKAMKKKHKHTSKENLNTREQTTRRINR